MAKSGVGHTRLREPPQSESGTKGGGGHTPLSGVGTGTGKDFSPSGRPDNKGRDYKINPER